MWNLPGLGCNCEKKNLNVFLRTFENFSKKWGCVVKKIENGRLRYYDVMKMSSAQGGCVFLAYFFGL